MQLIWIALPGLQKKLLCLILILLHFNAVVTNNEVENGHADGKKDGPAEPINFKSCNQGIRQ